MKRVLVARPEPGATRTAGRLRERGLEPVVLPLTEIVGLKLAGWPPASGFDAVVIASANAVRHAPQKLLEDVASLPAFAVGAQTAKAAREAGLAVAEGAAEDAGRLVERMADAMARGSRILSLCGRVRRDTLEEGLAKAGLKVETVEIYDTLPLSPPPDEVEKALSGLPVDVVLLHSAYSTEQMGRVLEGPAARLFRSAVYVAISERVSEALPPDLRSRTRVAGEPTEEAMFSIVEAGN